MKTEWSRHKDVIAAGVLLLALWALGGAFLALEFGFTVVVKVTAVYFILTTLIAAASYAVMVTLLRRAGIASGWKVISSFVVIFFGSIFEAWLVSKLIRPMISAQSGIAIANRVEPGFALYAVFGAMMLIFSVSCAIEKVRREYLEMISPKIDIFLDQNMQVHMNFKEGE